MQELKEADITIETTPKYVKYECPYCGEEVEIDYDDFEDEMPDDYWGDWCGERVTCEKCGRDFEINGVEVD